ncbi:MAG: hypothetical protein RL179_648 [Planctomycetota bacterium]|jgi:predicted dehydrogenase
MPDLKIGVVGVGHLGQQHARILSTLKGVKLMGVVDASRQQAENIALRYSTTPYTSHLELLPKVDAAVIVVPTRYHHDVAKDFLEQGKSLLIEKPITIEPEKAYQLCDLAKSRNTTIQVGHVERFNPAYEALCDLPMKPRYIRAERLGGFSGRSSDTGVVLDLMVHDIDLVCSLVRSEVSSVSGIGVAVLGGHEDIAQARITFANGTICDLSASRAHPEARRRMDVWGAEGYAGIDFISKKITLMQPSDSLRYLAESAPGRVDAATLNSFKAELFASHIETRTIDCSRSDGDQLTWELLDFVQAVTMGVKPRVDGIAGARAVEISNMILDGICSHKWEGACGNATGPWDLPNPDGKLFHNLNISKDAAA